MPREESLNVALPAPGEKPVELPVPNSGGLTLVVTCRSVPASTGLLTGTRSVSVFLVNNRAPDPEHGYRAFAFQAGLVLRSPEPFVPRPISAGSLDGSWPTSGTRRSETCSTGTSSSTPSATASRPSRGWTRRGVPGGQYRLDPDCRGRAG